MVSYTKKKKHVTVHPTRPLYAVTRTSEDGTPSVAFPRNFDRIVGLMGRHDLEDQSPDEEAKDDNRSSGSRRSPHDSAKDDGKGKGKGAGQGDRLPPWTKYLLEEGIDRTEAFSRYRGMLAGKPFLEQCLR